MPATPRGRGGQRRRDILNRDQINARATEIINAEPIPVLPRYPTAPRNAPIRPVFPGATRTDVGTDSRFLPVPKQVTDIQDRTPSQASPVMITPHQRDQNWLSGMISGTARANEGDDGLVDVQMDDGTIIEGVPANITQQDLLGRYNEFMADTKAGQRGSGYTSAFGGGFMDQALLGGADEVGSALIAATPWRSVDKALGAIGARPTGLLSAWDEGQNFGDLYQRYRRTYNAEMDANRQNYPGTTLASNVTGALAPLMFTGGGSAAGGAGGAGGRGFVAGVRGSGGPGMMAGAGRLVREAAPVAAQSAAYGFNSADGSTAERLNAVPEALGAGMAGYLGMRALGAGASRAMGGRDVSDNVRLLAEEGVTMTPGQRAGMGSFRNTYEDKFLGSIPGVGDVVGAARLRGQNDLRVAAVNRALKPIGQNLPRGTPVNAETIGRVQDAINSSYDDALMGVNVTMDKNIADGLSKVLNEAPLTLAADDIGILNANAGRALQMLGDGSKPLGGNALRDTIQTLRGAASSAQNPELRSALWDIHRVLDDAIDAQSGPRAGASYRSAREAQALMARVNDAASKSVNSEFGPTQLLQAARRRGYGTNTANIASGDARLMDLANASADVMRNTTANSGTIPRAWMTGGLTALASGGAGVAVNPLAGAAVAAPLVGYAPGIDRALQAFSLNRPATMRAASRYLDDAGRPIGLLGMGLGLGALGR